MVVCGVGASGSAAADDGGRARKKPQLLFQSDGERPGQLAGLQVIGIATRHEKVVVKSPAFAHAVRLAYERDPMAEPTWGLSYQARGPISMKAGRGSYPLTVEIAGRVVDRGTVRVVASQRPSFEVSGSVEGVRPGESVGLSFDDLYPGKTGSSFTVHSKAFKAPVPLRHDDHGGYWNNPRMFEAVPSVLPDAADGTYKVVLTGPDGRRIAERRLTVRASRPGDYDYTGKVHGPEFFGKRGDLGATPHFRVRAGGRMHVLWEDATPDAGEENRLTATSPAFEEPVRLKRDDSKAADGSDPRYYGLARIRSGLDGGSYPVTVVSHHGRVKRSSRLVVTAAPGHHGNTPGQQGDHGGFPAVAVISGGAGALAVGATGVLLVRARRARTGDSR
ncbi:hypothetical protein ADL29_06225 [Streptomyces chattanoogensis]|uniref:Uncharacterized protein n=2 Tax=Streptomyces chattanoogensis TaxID=66876 RepID=A0A0N1JZK2_9ACTN|nr:hypothetical protein ADL29_06225 [Streptomyces chattanoogensis]